MESRNASRATFGAASSAHEHLCSRVPAHTGPEMREGGWVGANFPGRAPCSARGPLAGEDRESPPHARLSRAEKSWLAAVRDIL